MPEAIKLIECPRDAWQGLGGQIPTEVKAAYLQTLIAAGFRHIDAVSFVSPKAVPQMADSEEVLRRLQPPPEAEIIGIVVNEKGVERAIATGKVQTVGFPYSVSETFLRNNQKQSPEEALEVLEKIEEKAYDAGLGIVVYISMAFGNPYGDRWDAGEVVEAARIIGDMDIRQISLADTVGMADAETIRSVVGAVKSEFDDWLEVGVHLHSRPENGVEKISAAWEAGCRRFDSAIGGLGGCPFAQDELVGNIATEAVLEALRRAGAEADIPRTLERAQKMSAEIGARHGRQLP